MMLDIPNKIKFRNPSNAFQKNLKEQTRNIKKQDKLIVKADKTRNYYLLKPEDHTKLLSEAVTKEYKKFPDNVVDAINREAATIAAKFDIEDRVDKFRLQQPFFSIKDHKPTFPARVDTRLINPAKSNIGVMSKQILDRINATIRA